MINEIKRGEDYLAQEYGRVLADDTVSSDTRTLVAQRYDRVRRGHGLISELKHPHERVD